MAAAELTKKIYSLAAVCGVLKSGSHDDGLHDIVYLETGKTSVRELSESEAKRVIAELQGYLRVSTPEPPPAKAAVSNEQVRLAFRLVHRLAELDPKHLAASPRERLAGAIFKVTGIIPKRDGDLFEGFSEEQASQLIETLKRYVRSAERKSQNV